MADKTVLLPSKTGIAIDSFSCTYVPSQWRLTCSRIWCALFLIATVTILGRFIPDNTSTPAKPHIRLESLSASLIDVSGTRLSGRWNMSFLVEPSNLYEEVQLEITVAYKNQTLSQGSVLPRKIPNMDDHVHVLNASTVSLRQEIGAETVKAILTDMNEDKTVSFGVDLVVKERFTSNCIECIFTCGEIKVSLYSADTKSGYMLGNGTDCSQLHYRLKYFVD